MKKRILSYHLLGIALIISIAMLNVFLWEKNSDNFLNKVTVTESNESPTTNDHHFTAFDTSCIQNVVLRSQPSGAQITATKANQGNGLIKTFFDSLLAQQHLHTTKSIYVSFYAEKQLRGYYIYALCKLLI